MKKIYLALLTILAVLTLKAAPDIYAPTLKLPANQATKIFPDVFLDWEPVTGLLGLYYEVQLDTNAEFTNPAVFTTDLTRYQMSLLKFNQVYYWRVRAIDASATSSWSDVRSFTTVATVTIKKPSANASAVNPNVQIIWEDLTGADHATYQIDVVETFDSPALIETTVANVDPYATNASALHFGQTYFIRMRASHSADTSDWSASRSFTVTTLLEVTTPENVATGIAPNVEFKWKKLDGLIKYQLQLSTDTSLTQYEAYNVPAGVLKISPDTLLFNTTYTWQLAGMHATDTIFSEKRSFTTIDKVTLTSPSNNSTNIVLTPEISWEEIEGVIGYEVQIANNPDFNNVYTHSITSNTPLFKIPIHVLDSGNVYHWRVRAISSRDTSNYSDAWSFRSVTVGMEESIASKNGVKLYPVPASNKVTISVKNNINGVAQVEVYDLLGNKRMSTNVNFAKGVCKDFVVSNLTEGVYMMSIIADGQRTTTKLIIRK